MKLFVIEDLTAWGGDIGSMAIIATDENKAKELFVARTYINCNQLIVRNVIDILDTEQIVLIARTCC